jgi:hypothetical protein
MDEINDLKDWINNPPISRGAAAFVLAFSLDEFSRNREGLDFLKAFADRTEAYAKGRGCDYIRISISNSVLVVCDQEMIVSGTVSEIKLILLRMIGRMLPDYFGVIDINRLAQLFDLRRDRERAIQAVERMEQSAGRRQQLVQHDGPVDDGAHHQGRDQPSPAGRCALRRSLRAQPTDRDQRSQPRTLGGDDRVLHQHVGDPPASAGRRRYAAQQERLQPDDRDRSTAFS